MPFENTILKIKVKHLIKLLFDNWAIGLKLLFQYKLLTLIFKRPNFWRGQILILILMGSNFCLG